MSTNVIKVTGLEHLRSLVTAKKSNYLDCFLANGILRSSKQIDYNAGAKRPWYVFNSIDGTDDELNDEELMEQTSIGMGIERGCLYAETN